MRVDLLPRFGIPEPQLVNREENHCLERSVCPVEDWQNFFTLEVLRRLLGPLTVYLYRGFVELPIVLACRSDSCQMHT